MTSRRTQPAAAVDDDDALVKVLTALSDPLRLDIVRRLATRGPISCSELRQEVPFATLSRHLTILREAGVVLTVPDGTRRINSLRRTELEQRFPGVLASILALGRARMKRTESRHPERTQKSKVVASR